MRLAHLQSSFFNDGGGTTFSESSPGFCPLAGQFGEKQPIFYG